MSYFKELERQWRANRQRTGRAELLKRPKSLRGPEFVRELARLSVLTGDERFDDAGRALFAHGIIDADMNFTQGWDAPEKARAKKDFEQLIVKFISLNMSNGKSQRHACAEVAAMAGYPAKTFEAAVRLLQQLFLRI